MRVQDDPPVNRWKSKTDPQREIEVFGAGHHAVIMASITKNDQSRNYIMQFDRTQLLDIARTLIERATELTDPTDPAT